MMGLADRKKNKYGSGLLNQSANPVVNQIGPLHTHAAGGTGVAGVA